MTPEQTVDILEGLLVEFDAEFQRLLAREAQTLSSVTQESIIQSGESGIGKLGNYSTKAGYFQSPEGVAQVTPRGKNGKTGGKTRYFEDGYFGYRKEIGREANFVNLELSTQMFQGIQIIEASTTGTVSRVVIDGVNQETLDKLDGNFLRYGDFMTPKQEDIDNAEEDFANDVTAFINERLG